MADLSLLLHAAERAEALFERRARINAMELIELDALELETPQAHLDTLNQIACASTCSVFAGPCRVMPPLVAITKPAGIGMQCLGDQALGDFGPISVCGVDECDA